MKLFFITSRFPYPLEKGDKLRVYYQLVELSRHFDIYLFTLAESTPTSAHLEAVRSYCKDIEVVVHKRSDSIRSILKGLFSKIPVQTHYFYSDKLESILQAAVEKIGPDHIHFHLIRTTEYLKEYQKNSSLDFMDSFSLGLRGLEKKRSVRMRLFYKYEGALVEQYEQETAQRFEQCFIISNRDRQHIDQEDQFPISVLKNGIDLSYFEAKDVEKKYDIVFVGNLGYQPNIEAVKEVNALALKRPEWKFLVAGARSESLSHIRFADNITMAGWVEDIRNAYCSGKIFLAPIHHGSGLQNKILEAMRLQLPCITTTFVNAAIQAEPNREILIADSIEEMEQTVIDLFNNKRQLQNYGQAGFKFVTKHFSWEEKTKPLIEYIKGKQL